MLRFLPVSTWTQGRSFLKTFQFCMMVLVLDLGKKVSRGATAEGVISEAEASQCDCPQQLNCKIQLDQGHCFGPPFNLSRITTLRCDF